MVVVGSTPSAQTDHLSNALLDMAKVAAVEWDQKRRPMPKPDSDDRHRQHMHARAATSHARALIAFLAGLMWFAPRPVAALHYLEAEEDISELMVKPHVEERERGEKKKLSERAWAILPQVGYGPETSFVFGAKFTNRDIYGSGVTLDLDGVYAIEGQQGFAIGVASPRSFGPNIPIIFHALYRDDPRRRFYGLGNNTQGPDQASSHEFQRFGGDITIGWWLLEHLSLNVQGGAWHGDIQLGDQIDDEPQTVDRFPNLPGLGGGVLVPLAVSLVYDDREGLTRPTRGWRVLLRTSYDVGEFHFARFIADVSYLYPLFHERLVLGARLNGHWLGGRFENIPFWALADLGGEYTLRGYFPYRFLGVASLLTSVEARVKLFKFNFFDVWRVVVDGVGFGAIGRIFMDDEDIRRFQGTDRGPLEQTGEVPISYGAGIRFALSEAILARVDVGFSNEETALVYLTFGHTF